MLMHEVSHTHTHTSSNTSCELHLGCHVLYEEHIRLKKQLNIKHRVQISTTRWQHSDVLVYSRNKKNDKWKNWYHHVVHHFPDDEDRNGS